MADRGTKVIKIMLNVSQGYQLERFKRRLDDPGRKWKFNPGDLDERKHWRDYMSAFELAIEQCSSLSAPWSVIPAENRPFRDAVVSKILLQASSELNPQYPQPDYDPALYTSSTIT